MVRAGLQESTQSYRPCTNDDLRLADALLKFRSNERNAPWVGLAAHSQVRARLSAQVALLRGYSLFAVLPMEASRFRNKAALLVL